MENYYTEEVILKLIEWLKNNSIGTGLIQGTIVRKDGQQLEESDILNIFIMSCNVESRIIPLSFLDLDKDRQN